MAANIKDMKIAIPVTYLVTLDMDLVDEETAKGVTVQDILDEIKRNGIKSRLVHDFEIAHVGNLIGGKG